METTPKPQAGSKVVFGLPASSHECKVLIEWVARSSSYSSIDETWLILSCTCLSLQLRTDSRLHTMGLASFGVRSTANKIGLLVSFVSFVIGAFLIVSLPLSFACCKPRNYFGSTLIWPLRFLARVRCLPQASCCEPQSRWKTIGSAEARSICHKRQSVQSFTASLQ